MNSIRQADRQRRINNLTNAFRAGSNSVDSSPTLPVGNKPDRHDSITDEHADQLARLPHSQQVEILTCPGGTRARELAAITVEALEAKGIGL